MHVPICLFSSIPLILAQINCQDNGTWSAWLLSGSQPNGYDYCGGCWNANFTRFCQSFYLPNCPCTGISTQFAYTNTEPCPSPRSPCCPDFELQPDGTCGPISPPLAPDSQPPNNTFCTTEGWWGEWGAWSICNATCGMCGTTQRSRACKSQDWGCSCYQNNTRACQTKACGGPPCTTGPQCCGNATLIVGYDGAEYCNPFAAKIEAAGENLTCTGSWTEWADACNAACAASCGNCGTRQQERFCFPSGCSCGAGDRTRTSPIPCPDTSCSPPDNQTECCAPYEVNPLKTPAIFNVPCESTWSQWYKSENQTSWDYCGGCFEEEFYRVCLSNETCLCKGPGTFTAPGNIGVCYYPRTSCCGNLFHVIIDGAHGCGPQVPFPPDPAPPADNQTACSDYGYWGSWGSWSTCNSTCGMCGTRARNRTCISEAWNCSCCDDGIETQKCGGLLCTTGSPCCNGSYLVTLFDGQQTCKPGTELICNGTWTNWAQTSPSCSATCGSCGTMIESRQCWPSGCQCDGAFNRTSLCNTQLCPAPNQCCSPYAPVTNATTGTTTCGNCTGETYSWTEWADAPEAVCSDTCGSCGSIALVRKCACGCCPTTEPTTRTALCGQTVCLYPRQSCCTPYKKVIQDGKFICGLDLTTPAPITTMTTPAPSTTPLACPPGGGTWGTWRLAPYQVGYDICGACWKANYVRDCLNGVTCPCIGPSTAQADANIGVCLYPRASCCPGKTKIMTNDTTNTFICGPPLDLPAEPAPPSNPTACMFGYWGNWGSWTACTASCGQCGTRQRTRTCTSAPSCACYKQATEGTQIERCIGYLCTSGSACCNGFANVIGYDGYQYCGTATSAPVCTGSWTEWVNNFGATCSDTCGNCGLVPQSRSCFPSGCQCPGAYTRQAACADTVCLYPRQSCCTPYKKVIVGGKFVCG